MDTEFLLTLGYKPFFYEFLWEGFHLSHVVVTTGLALTILGSAGFKILCAFVVLAFVELVGCHCLGLFGRSS